jgi:hypothetical protein
MHYCIVHHNGAHTNEYIIMNGAAMHNGIMPDGNIIADRCSVFLVSAMDAGSVLHIYFVTQLNKIHIATQHRVEPETAIITGNHIANDSGIGGNEAVVAELGVLIFYGKYDGHL